MRAETNSPVEAALDGLLEALQPHPSGDGRYRFDVGHHLFADRVFGGQLLAQAIAAAGATVAGKTVSSVHALFVEAGDGTRPVDAVVDPLRDGRSVAMSRVRLEQEGRVLLEALVSFHANTDGPGFALAAPEPAASDDLSAPLRGWSGGPLPVEVRMSEQLTFLGGTSADGPRAHHMRAPRDVGDDPVLHAALLGYASDFFLMDMVFRSHPDGAGLGRWSGFSVDHALWLHRPPRFDQWHRFTQEAVALVGDRGVARGAIHDEEGRLVATVTQEVVVRGKARTVTTP